VGIEEYKTGDRNVVYHLADHKDNCDGTKQEDTQLFILNHKF
jgi:hypothetical protein